MTTPARPQVRGLAGRQGLFVTLGLLAGLFGTDFWPLPGLVLGVGALVVVIASLVTERMPRWLGWLAQGFVAGVALFFLLALFATMNPTPRSGAGSGGP
ncbi:hypothetical protein [Micropruina sp.]|uniref:hypothetical protein n=1 Tax=Micropruina sp. TaxID=2737536 RepID=UPI0039E5B529